MVDLPLAADAPGGMVPYRRTLSTSFFYKFFLHVQSELGVSLSPKVFSPQIFTMLIVTLLADERFPSDPASPALSR